MFVGMPLPPSFLRLFERSSVVGQEMFEFFVSCAVIGREAGVSHAPFEIEVVLDLIDMR